jgi:hypothetical protein
VGEYLGHLLGRDAIVLRRWMWPGSELSSTPLASSAVTMRLSRSES